MVTDGCRRVITNLEFIQVLWDVVFGTSLGTVRASNYIYLNPLVTMIASFLILDEKITLVALGGAACIVCGVYWAEKK